MASSVRIVFLGGLGEIGRNCCCIEVDDRILLIDCGIMFPDSDMPGVDLVLPDFTYLRENAEKVEAILLTHAHEDHAGGIAFLLRDVAVPVYGSALSLALARNRIEEAGMLDRTELIPVADGERRRIGPVDCQFIPVTHSVPHGFAIAFFTPAGTIIHSGDFKLDLTPVDGRRTNLAMLGDIASREGGVRLLMSDSTNAERPGFTPSESTVGAAMRSLFREYPDKRFIVTSFASHLHRVQQVAQAAIANGRKIAFVGRSMQQNMAMARERGLRRHSRVGGDRHRGGAQARAGRGVHRVHRVAGRADERALAHGRARAQVREDLARRRRGHQRPRDSGQRVERLSRDRLAPPSGRGGRARPHVAGARLGPRLAGGAEVPAQPARARMVRAGARRVPAPRSPRAARPGGRCRARSGA